MEAKDVNAVDDVNFRRFSELINIIRDVFKKGIEVVMSKSCEQFDTPAVQIFRIISYYTMVYNIST